MCGEKCPSSSSPSITGGSPPRVRGKAHLCILLQSGMQDHPRVCGEKSPSTVFMLHVAGSPPRVRGKVIAAIDKPVALRITPACAGKSDSVYKVAVKWKDHPRVCGEKTRPPRRKTRREGSPPRVRGKDTSFFLCCRRSRITPACAGKSDTEKEDSADTEDHPRVCGEKHVQIVDLDKALGSPPRVRGKARSNR